MFAQLSRGASMTWPESRVGQLPVAAWCASAQARICSSVSVSPPPRFLQQQAA